MHLLREVLLGLPHERVNVAREDAACLVRAAQNLRRVVRHHSAHKRTWADPQQLTGVENVDMDTRTLNASCLYHEPVLVSIHRDQHSPSHTEQRAPPPTHTHTVHAQTYRWM